MRGFVVVVGGVLHSCGLPKPPAAGAPTAPEAKPECALFLKTTRLLLCCRLQARRLGGSGGSSRAPVLVRASSAGDYVEDGDFRIEKVCPTRAS